MASRIMHLLLARELLKTREFAQPEAFLFGSLLPDAPRSETAGKGNRASHFLADRDPLRTYDLEAFRRLYGDRLREEGLYLGYYLHLVQDSVYRRFQHGKWRWGRLSEEEFHILYRDYSRLNGQFIRRYGLKNTVKLPENGEKEDVCLRFSLRPGELLEQMEEDFRREEPGEPEEPGFLTWEMAQEFVEEAFQVCQKELSALSGGGPLLDPWSLAWNRLERIR
ncbi:hypothetical protein D7X94_11535 [Acutalibacter sp. 1XD8-33]|uniref:zinc dependent phospholipase C family protein n=1 Tax=Acutalibacter sp. 1XD8-33 TaxID=2320081 RepID=UPI000EA0D294|nr:zinc dependent phospholipase C family protein [Acutalibacter sp. 1XD8-33]RKJ39590.1 hypothetical protein D7X94_11535 [Acutalibacter sp. 1XD8-33]